MNFQNTHASYHRMIIRFFLLPGRTGLDLYQSENLETSFSHDNWSSTIFTFKFSKDTLQNSQFIQVLYNTLQNYLYFLNIYLFATLQPQTSMFLLGFYVMDKK